MQKTAQEMREQRKAQEAREKAQLEKLKADPREYLKYLYKKRKSIIGAAGATKKKGDFNRKGAAAQRRMQTIVELGLEDAELRGPGTKKKPEEDTFGADDQDWAVYLDIGKGGDESDGEDLDVRLAEVEAEISGLSSHFGDFFGGNQKARLTSSADFQINLNSEVVQFPELLFRPYICGLKQAGVSEVFQQLV